MPLSKRQKRLVKKNRVKRAKGELPTECRECGTDIYDSIHHFYCRKCWSYLKRRDIIERYEDLVKESSIC
jgi:Zn finger protein HypA/HybF involved in hydrogenase expression